MLSNKYFNKQSNFYNFTTNAITNGNFKDGATSWNEDKEERQVVKNAKDLVKKIIGKAEISSMDVTSAVRKLKKKKGLI